MRTSMPAALRRIVAIGPALTALLMIATPESAAAQATVYYACYVPSSGTVYRIKEPGLPTECGTTTKKGVTTQHVEFSWSPDISDHGGLNGLGNDDHAQYLLTNGVRNATDGFAVTGTLNVGSIPATGGGARLMWYPRKAAFRAGWVISNHWDDANVGEGSVAFGMSSRASGHSSVAIGLGSDAAANGAVALAGGDASGTQSLAMVGNASALAAIAIGSNTLASGELSVALGSLADTNDKRGAFVYGDASSQTHVEALTDNHFVVRAGRFWLGNDNNVTATFGRFLETSTGAFLSSGGTWTNSSDVNRKTAFEDVDGDEVLTKVASLPIRSWSYKNEDASVRHIGPTAQDFSAAFGLGGTDKAIATVDADGVSLAAIQALAKRTAELKRENEALRSELRALAERLASLLLRSGSTHRP
ncbi:MAG: tail fiber domain-containing protein [Longimicrobiales bacterium]